MSTLREQQRAAARAAAEANLKKLAQQTKPLSEQEAQALSQQTVEAMRQAGIPTPPTKTQASPLSAYDAFESLDTPSEGTTQQTQQDAPAENGHVSEVSVRQADKLIAHRNEITNMSRSTEYVEMSHHRIDGAARNVDGFGGEAKKSAPLYYHTKRLPNLDRTVSERHVFIESLPSDFQVYDFQGLYMRPFTLDNLSTVAKWAETSEAEYIKQALDATLNVPLDDLVIQDAIFLMYFHRSLSYPKSPHTMEWTCETIEREGQKWDGCGHNNLTELRAKNVLVTHLSDLNFSARFMPEELDLPRMYLYSDWLWLNKQNALWHDYRLRKQLYDYDSELVQAGLRDVLSVEKPKAPRLDVAPEDLMLYNAALFVKAEDCLQAKVDWLRNRQEDLELLQVALQYSRNLVFGVAEKALVECANCGAQRKFSLTLSPAAFYP